MAIMFVKVRPCVAAKMGLDNLRSRTEDGNYLLWPPDFQNFGPLFRLGDYAAEVGGAVLTDRQAAAEQRGELRTELPRPSDPQWEGPEKEADTETDVPEDKAGNGDGPQDVTDGPQEGAEE